MAKTKRIIIPDNKPGNETNTTLLYRAPMLLRRRKSNSPKDIHEIAHNNFVRDVNNISQTPNATKTRDSGTVDAPNIETGRRGIPRVPSSISQGKRRIALANNMEGRIVHRTHYKTGQPPTSTIKQLMKLNGTRTSSFDDSKVITPGDASSVSIRDTMAQGSGFNCKTYHVLPPIAHVSFKNMNMILNPLQGNDSQGVPIVEPNKAIGTSTKITYSIVNAKQQLLIHNNSPFLPMNCTIHIVKQRDVVGVSECYLNDFARCFYTANDFLDIEQEISTETGNQGELLDYRYIPFVHQLSGYRENIIDASADVRFDSGDVDVSMRLRSLLDSPYFNEKFHLIDSVKKMIPSGDFWSFIHTHFFGAGLDFDKFTAKAENEGGVGYLNPLTYFFIIETHGTLVEGLYKDGAGANEITNYLGTSPTYYVYEYQNSATYVKQDELGSTLGTEQNAYPHFRTWTRDRNQYQANTPAGTEMRKEIYVAQNNIVDSLPGSATTGQMVIPNFSNQELRTTREAGGLTN